jgi:TonB-linked SusC/RagA family outer membrane protein
VACSNLVSKYLYQEKWQSIFTLRAFRNLQSFKSMKMTRLLFTLMATVLCTTQLLAQSRTIAGKVKSDDGAGIPDASVTIKGSKSTTSTKGDGSFSLSTRLNSATLVVSSPEFITREIPINASTEILDISLRRLPEIVLDTAEIIFNVSDTGNILLDTAELVFDESEILPGESIVVAYGTTRRRSVTGSIAQIHARQFTNRPLTNITTAIEGNIAGVMNTSVNGQPGSGLNMRVRGFGTFNANSEPLLIVDGIPYVGHSSNVNVADVESITVLKDAASTAMYGSRGGNGVVIITTKKGRKRNNSISVRMMQGVVTRGLDEYERVGALQYYPLMWEAYRNSLVYPISGTGISLDSANRVASGLTSRLHIQNLLSYNPFNVANNAIVGVDGQLSSNAQLLYPDDLDWNNELFRRAPRSDYSLNFNGGGENSDYFLSLGYVKENGYILKSDFERYTARLNVNVQPQEWLKTGLNVFANYSKSYVGQDSGSNDLVNPFYFTRNIGPIYPVYAHNVTTGEFLIDPVTGQKFFDFGNMGGRLGVPNRTSGSFAGRHALAETILNEKFFKRTSVGARSYQEITFLKNFRFINNLSVDYQIQTNNSYDNPLVGDGAPIGRSQKESISNFSFVASQLLNYGKTFDVHTLDILVGHESFNQLNTFINGFKQGQTVGGNIDLGNFSTINSTGSYEDRYKIESYFGRLNYDLDDRYLLSATVRRDGNSAFYSDSRWGTFWSVGAGWNLSNENLLGNINWINLLKLRGSYGVVGMADGTGSATSIGHYAYQGLYNFSNNANEPGIIQSQTQPLLNPQLTWEKNTQLDIGLDFTLFRNRINGSVDYFERKSSDLLFAIPQPLSSGVLSIIQNAASMKNTGVELHLSADILRSKTFVFNTTINLATLTNTITEMPASVPEFTTGTKKYSEGQSIFDYWLPTYYGVDPDDGAALYKAANTLIAANRRIIDNKSGGSDTVTVLASNALFENHGSSIPDLYGSFSPSLSFKGITLSALFTFQLGGKTFDANYQGLMSSGTYGVALSTDILNRWQKAGDITDIPRMDQGRTTDFNTTSSRWLIDASYLNIRAVSLAYTLPSSFISRLNLSTARFFISAENVAFFSKRKGLNNQQSFSGVTSNSYTPATVISAGLTLNL